MVVLDASAVLAMLFDEPGRVAVEDAIAAGAMISTVNLAEVMARLVRDGVTAGLAADALSRLPVLVQDLDHDVAIRSGALVTQTRPYGLSLGDRVCLALAAREKAPALTADRAWDRVAGEISVTVRLIR